MHETRHRLRRGLGDGDKDICKAFAWRNFPRRDGVVPLTRPPPSLRSADAEGSPLKATPTHPMGTVAENLTSWERRCRRGNRVAETRM